MESQLRTHKFLFQDAVLLAELEQVYRQHRQALFSLALTITACAGLAEDAVHDVFVRLLGLQQSPSGRLAAYVFSAVRNSARDCCRRVKRDLKLAETVIAETPDSGMASTLGSEVSTRHLVMPDLPAHVRDAFKNPSTTGSQFVESGYQSAVTGAVLWEPQNREVFSVATHVSDRRFDMCRDCHRVGG